MTDPTDRGPSEGCKAVRQLGLSRQDRLVLLAVSIILLAVIAIEWLSLSSVKNLPSRVEVAVQVDLNSAGVEELSLLPGVGEKTAILIVRDREANGPFETIYNLGRVKGIGPFTIEKIAPYAVCR